MVFQWSLSDSKSPQVSRTLLCILAVLINVVVWIVSIRPPTSKSFCLFHNRFVTVPKAPITIGIIVSFIFIIFFQNTNKDHVFILLFTFLQFYSVISRDSKVDNFESSLFLLIIIIYGLLPRLGDAFVSQSLIGVCVCHSPGQMLGCAYTICS